MIAQTPSLHQLPTSVHLPLSEKKGAEPSQRIVLIALAILATLCIALGATYLFFGEQRLFYILGTLLLGGFGISKYILGMNDYSDPAQLEKYRKTAETEPLAKTVGEHGWENILRYHLLPSTLLQEKFEETAKENFAKFLELYQEGKSTLLEGAWQLDESGLMPLWKTIVQDKNPLDVFDTYSLQGLISLGLVDLNLKKGYQEYQEAQDTLSKEKQQANKAFNETVDPLIEGTALTLELLENSWTGQGFGALLLSGLSSTFTHQFAQAKKEQSDRIRAAETIFFKKIENLNHDYKPHLIKG